MRRTGSAGCQKARDRLATGGVRGEAGTLTDLGLSVEIPTNALQKSHAFGFPERVQNPWTEGLLANFIPAAEQLLQRLEHIQRRPAVVDAVQIDDRRLIPRSGR